MRERQQARGPWIQFFLLWYLTISKGVGEVQVCLTDPISGDTWRRCSQNDILSLLASFFSFLPYFYLLWLHPTLFPVHLFLAPSLCVSHRYQLVSFSLPVLTVLTLWLGLEASPMGYPVPRAP